MGDPFPIGGVLGLGLESPYIYERWQTKKRRRNRGEKRNRDKRIERRTTTKKAGERGRQFRNYGIYRA